MPNPDPIGNEEFLGTHLDRGEHRLRPTISHIAEVFFVKHILEGYLHDKTRDG